MTEDQAPERGEERPAAPRAPVRWLDRARTDLVEIAAYIGRDDLAAADRWIDELIEAADEAAVFPSSGAACRSTCTETMFAR